MPPKAKAKAKPRRLRCAYRPRGNPAPVLTRATARRTAYLARPGVIWECSMCGHGRHIPNDHAPAKIVKCDMTKVRLLDGDVIQCLGRTTASSWRQGTELSSECAAARHAAMEGLIMQTDQDAQAGNFPKAQFWANVLEKMRAVPAPAALEPAAAGDDAA